MRVILFGTGKYYQKWKHIFDYYDITVLLDNNPDKIGTFIDNHLVESPNKISQYEYDYIFILAKCYQEMRLQLLQQGVSEDVILDIENPGRFTLVSPIVSYMVNNNNDGKHVLMFSHTLERTGAPLVLLDAAKILNRNNYQVHVISLTDGPLRDKYIQNSISVSIMAEMNPSNYSLKLYLQWADIVFVNTLVFYSLMDIISKNARDIIWWLHEEENYYMKSNINPAKHLEFNNVRIFGVGLNAIRAFGYYFPGVQIEELLYGVRSIDIKEYRNKKIVFALIGSCDYRKGEDIFRAAIQKLNQDNSECEYWIIGMISDYLRKAYESIPGVKLFGEIDHEELMNLYPHIDVIVCPSRNDPMPVVITEGMMMGKICIISEKIGQAAFLQDGESGLICATEDIGKLYEKMKWAIDNRKYKKKIGTNAKKIYEKYFSMDQFEKNLLKIIGDSRR